MFRGGFGQGFQVAAPVTCYCQQRISDCQIAIGQVIFVPKIVQQKNCAMQLR